MRAGNDLAEHDLMRSSLVAIALLSLTGCPSPELCSEAPELADVSIEIVAGEAEDVVTEGGPIPFLLGAQGSQMAIFSVAYASDDISGCLVRRLVVRTPDGTHVHGRADAVPIEVRPEGDVWMEPQVQVIDPPPGPLVIEVEAYGTTLVRTVEPRGSPRPVAFSGATVGTVGAPMELTLELDGPAPGETFVEIAIDPPDAATVEPAELRLPYGAMDATVAVTPTRAGTITVTARTYDYDVHEASITLTAE